MAELLEEDDDNIPSPKQEPGPSADDDSAMLKKKLEEMEKQMAMLKQQLSSQNSPKPKQSLKDIGLNFQTGNSTSKQTSEEEQIILKNDSESSDEDEEGNRVTKKYNEFGQFVKQRLAHQPNVDRLKSINCPQGWKSNQGALKSLSNTPPQQKQLETSNDNGFTDPFFGIKIINPVVSSTSLAAKMEGRKQIRASQIRAHMRGGEIKDDWVTMAVVVSKGEPRTSQNGKKYSIWKLSDLKDCTKLVSFFLFGEVFNIHWKMAVGSVIGILNPNFMKDEKKTDEISFTVDNHQKVLLIGSSKVKVNSFRLKFVMPTFDCFRI